MLSPLVGVRGNGGGGGGGALMLADREGGAGGGAVEITSGGTLTVSAASRILARGAVGDNADVCVTGGGAGGGGSGGAVLLRALAMTIEDGAVADVSGASGGTAQTGQCRGGLGGDGFQRLDAVLVEDIGDAIDGALRGPMWDPDSPVVAREAEARLTLVGAAGARYFLSVNASPTSDSRMMQTAREAVAVDLEPGLNLVCALMVETGALNQPESLNCVDVVYLP